MPMRPPRACATCGQCGCTAHPRQTWREVPAPARIRGRRLLRLRARLFAEHPLCVACQQAGRVAVATIRDHIIPLAEGGRDDETNVQALCQTCSDRKTATESQRGRLRGRGGRM